MHTPQKLRLTPLDKLPTLVEHRQVFALKHLEVNVFETHQATHQVPLAFNSLVLTTMLRGRKVMHLPQASGFDYLPGESVIVQAHDTMVIDFPDATPHSPTQCLALAIDPHLISSTLEQLNDRYPRAETSDTWHVNPQEGFHLQNSRELADVIDRTVRISQNRGPETDLLAELTTRELLIRLLQSQARQLILHQYRSLASRHRFAAVVEFIQQHLHRPIRSQELSSLACMSNATFFRSFRQEFGLSPADYINEQRLLRARTLLAQPQLGIQEVAMLCGFQNLGHFYKVFGQHFGVTPKVWRGQLTA